MRRRAHSVAEVLRQALPPKARDRIFSLEFVQLKWVSAVGRDLAARSEPVSLENGVLTVRVEDAAWGRMILKLQREIRTRLNEAMGMGTVKRVRFMKDGEAVRRLEPEEPADRAGEAFEPPESIISAAEAVEDPALRSFLIRTASRYLAAQAGRRR
jgi:hypothetical protein